MSTLPFIAESRVRIRERPRGLLQALPLGVAIAIGYLIVGRGAVATTALCLLLLFGLVAVLRPGWVPACASAVLVLPYVWSPSFHGAVVTPIIPVAAVAGLVGLATVRLRPTLIDLPVLALVVLPGLSAYMIGESRNLFQYGLLNIAVPYVGFRIFFAAHPGVLRRLPGAVLWTGVPIAVLALIEAYTGFNVASVGGHFVNADLEQWTQSYTRGGLVRAQATFGHPIALGCFLVMPLAFAVLKRRWALLFLFSVAEIVTFSRGPYVTGLLAVIALLVIFGQGARRVLALVSVLAALLAFAGPVKTVVRESYSAGSEAQANFAYRQALLSESFHGVTLFGDPVPQSRTDELFAGSQFTDVTSYLALTIRRLGLLGLIAWVGVLATALLATIGAVRRSDDLATTFGVIVGAWWIALLSVSLITNFQFAFWLVLAALATRQALASEQRGERGEA
jgi:hypothetical protein